MLKKRRRREPYRRKNPQLYSRTEALSPERRKGSFFRKLLFLFLALLIYVVLFSPAFKYKEILYSGSPEKKEDVLGILESAEGKMFKNNMLFFNVANVKEALSKNSDINEVSISKNYIKRTINIKVETKEAMAVWDERGKKFYLDHKGFGYKEIGEGEEGKAGLIKINNKLNTIHTVGEQFLNERENEFIKNIIKNFELKISDKITSIDFENSLSEVTVYTSGYKIFLDTKRDPIKQLESAQLVKKDAEKKKKKFDYIDLRVESRVFYKFK